MVINSILKSDKSFKKSTYFCYQLIHKEDLNIMHHNKALNTKSLFANRLIKCNKPLQFRNNIFHLIENQHFNFNVGFFLSVGI